MAGVYGVSTAAGVSVTNSYGIYGTATNGNTSVNTYGGYFLSATSWNGANSFGSYGMTSFSGPAGITLTNGYGVFAKVKNSSTGTITNAYGVYVSLDPGSGTFTNRTGLYLEDVGSGANYFNIYSAGVGKNYFSGNVGIGTTTPAYALTVSGDVSISGNFKVNGTNISTSSGTVTN